MGQTSGLGNKHRPPYREGWRSVSSMDLPAGAFTGVKNTLFFQKMRFCPSCESPVTTRGTENSQPFTFTGKEKDEETGFSYFGARYYDSDLSGLFLSFDPMSDKYPSVSPYVYCAWNPIKLIDPDGRRVKPFGNRALTAIKNTLPPDARNYVTLNEEGYIDLDRLEQYSGDCYNYNCLKELVSSEEYNIEIHLSNSFSYKDRNGQFVEKDESSIMYYFPADGIPYDMGYTTSGLFKEKFGDGFINEAGRLHMTVLKNSKNNE